jgi:hypothetical protein
MCFVWISRNTAAYSRTGLAYWFAILRQASITCIMFVCPPVHLSICTFAWNTSASTGRIYMKSDIRVFFENLLKKIQVLLNSDRNNYYFTWKPKYILIISCSVLLRMRNFSDEHCKWNQNTKVMLRKFFVFRKSYSLWNIVEKHCTAGQATNDHVAHAHCMLDT